MKNFISVLFFVFCITISVYAEEHDIKDFYIEISESQAKRSGFDESFDDKYFVKVRLTEGLYEVEVGDKLDSKFYKIQYSKYYMLFRYAPYLYKFDEGIIKVTNGYDAGVFIEKD